VSVHQPINQRVLRGTLLTVAQRCFTLLTLMARVQQHRSTLNQSVLLQAWSPRRYR
jgi:hypothetical protein